MNRRKFFKAATKAGLGMAAVELMSEAVASGKIQDAPSRQNSTRSIILANASLIDSVRPEPQLNATVVVKDGRIVRVGTFPPTQTERQDAAIIDLGGAWLLPGLCDAHTHFISPLQEPPGE